MSPGGNEGCADPSPRRRWTGLLAATLVPALLSLGVCLARTWSLGLPEPIFHDEQSLLLLADTLRSGRLSNPTPRGWEHFETFHVLMVPTYASKYFPASGLLLALGWKVAGHPIVGVWLSVTFLAAAMGWMLLGRWGVRWAILGGTLAATVSSATTYWGWSYWGGALPAGAAALVVGSVLWANRFGRATGLVLGLGLALLATSRPWEGLLVAAPSLAYLGARAWREKWERRRLVRLLLPAGLVLAAAAAAMLCYDHAVTGHLVTTPYQEYQRQYDPTPILFPRNVSSGISPEISYRHERFARLYEWWEDERRQALLPAAWPARLRIEGVRAVGVTLGFVLLPLVPIGLLALRTGERWWVGAVLALTVMALVTYPQVQPHYLAPATPFLYLSVVAGLAAALRRFGRRAGALVVSLVLVLVAVERFELPDPYVRVQRASPLATVRAPLEDQLVAAGGSHLMIVNYREGASPHREWVWNRASFDAAPVLWARSMGPTRDQELVLLYPRRQVWRVEVGRSEEPIAVSPWARPSPG